MMKASRGLSRLGRIMQRQETLEKQIVAAADRDIDEISKPDTETEGINWAEWETEEEESDVDVRKYN